MTNNNRLWEPENDIDDLVPFAPDEDLLTEPPTSDLDTPQHGVEVWYPAGEEDEDGD